MATIRTAIELQDNFSGILYGITNAVNMSLSVMEDLNRAMNEPVDTTSIQAAREAINEATIAAQEWKAAMQNVDAPQTSTPTTPQPSAPQSVPVQWQSDTMDVFTTSGVERFQQEIQSANNMLNTLNNTQERIAATAASTDLFPSSAVSDMNSMQSRLQAIQSKIQQIESNPMNLGTDTANAELEQLRTQLNQAVQDQEDLNRAMERMDVSAANEAYLRLSGTISNTERYIRDNTDEQGRFNRAIDEGTQGAGDLMNTIKGAVAAYASIQTIGKVIDLSDQLTSTTARLDLMNDGLQTTQDLQNMIYLSAEQSRGAYQATADAVSKLGLMAGDAFSSSEEIVAFTEQLNKQFTIAGTEAAGIEAAMLQLTQAMGSGVLRGEEYNSILEQAPNIIQNIAKYIEENEDVLNAVAAQMDMSVEDLSGNVKGNLKDIASEGIISAEIVKNAMFAAADETNAKFESMPKTFNQIWTSFQNNALMAFQPVLERMNEIANSEAFQAFVNNAVEGLSMVAGIVVEIFNLIASVGSFIGENWSWLSPIIYSVAGALAVYYGWLLLTRGAELIVAAAKGVMAAATMIATGATWAQVTAQYGLNGAMYACPIVWIIALIFLLIAALLLLWENCEGFRNFFGDMVTEQVKLLGWAWNNVIQPIANWYTDAMAACGHAAVGFARIVVNAFWDVVTSVTAAVREVMKSFDWLLNAYNSVISFFSGQTVTIEGFDALIDTQNSVRDDALATLDSYENNIVGAFDKVEWNKIPESEIDRVANAAGDMVRNFSLTGWIDDTISDITSGLNGINEVETPFSDKDWGTSLPKIANDIANDVGDVSENTSSIADSMDITEEDLKYLRDIAEQEAINRFTTAEISVDMSGMQNNISNGMDLDGVISGLTEGVNEAIDSMAEGVHD